MGFLSRTIEDYTFGDMSGQGVFAVNIKKVEYYTARSQAEGYKITFDYDSPDYSQERCFLFGNSREKKLHALKIAVGLENECDTLLVRGKCCVVKKRQKNAGGNGYPMYDYYFFPMDIMQTLIDENECPPLPHEKISDAICPQIPQAEDGLPF